MSQKSKFLQYIDYRVRVTITDSRMLVGTFLAYDKHMNVVLADTDQFRITKSKKTGISKQIKRTLGLVILRGQNIISLTAEAPPSQVVNHSHQSKKLEQIGIGKAIPINRTGTIPQQIVNKNTAVKIMKKPGELIPPTGNIPNNLMNPQSKVPQVPLMPGSMPKPPPIPPKQ